MSGGRREAERLRRKLESLGFTVTLTGSGHYKVRHPERPGTYVMGGSPSPRLRSMDNTRAGLRRMFKIKI